MDSIQSLRPKPVPHYQLEQLDDEFLLYHPDREKVMYCNSTASLLWGLCDGERTVADIVQLVGDVYEVDQKMLHDEVSQTLLHFYQEGAVEFRDSHNQPVSVPSE